MITVDHGLPGYNEIFGYQGNLPKDTLEAEKNSQQQISNVEVDLLTTRVKALRCGSLLYYSQSLPLGALKLFSTTKRKRRKRPKRSKPQTMYNQASLAFRRLVELVTRFADLNLSQSVVYIPWISSVPVCFIIVVCSPQSIYHRVDLFQLFVF